MGAVKVALCQKTLEKFYVSNIKFGLFEKGTKFEKIFHLKFDVTE